MLFLHPTVSPPWSIWETSVPLVCCTQLHDKALICSPPIKCFHCEYQVVTGYFDGSFGYIPKSILTALSIVPGEGGEGCLNTDEGAAMDNKDSEAEIHPLKTEDVKAQENHENSVERRIISKQPSQLSRLSRWRTAAFFISLFLCLIIVFAFSFIIPCPERPVSERTWFRNYDNAGELDVAE